MAGLEGRMIGIRGMGMWEWRLEGWVLERGVCYMAGQSGI